MLPPMVLIELMPPPLVLPETPTPPRLVVSKRLLMMFLLMDRVV